MKTKPQGLVNPPHPTAYRQIEILGNVTDIQWIPQRIMSGAFGEQDLAHAEIRIQDHLRGIQCLDTLLHEIFHVCSDLLHLELTEHQVHNLGMAWAQIFSSNPELLNFIAERTQEENARRIPR
jgi:hypothetical protein